MERSKFNVDKDKEKRTHNGIVFDSQLVCLSNENVSKRAPKK